MDEHTTELGRLLTEEECDWLNIRGFELGYDLDSCSPQLNHIVVVHDSRREKVEPICGASTLWFSSEGWNMPRGDGVHHEKDRQLKCAACVSKFDELFEASETRTKRGFAWTLLHKRQRDSLEELLHDMREMGRPDLAIMLDAIRVAYFTDTEMSESALRYMMSNILALKSERIRRAMDLLRTSDE